MTRLNKWITGTVASVCLAMSVSAASAQDTSAIKTSPRELMRGAVARALAEMGLQIESGTVETGRLTTAWTPVATDRLPVVVRQDAKPAAWGRAEYRLDMSMSIAANGVMNSGLRAEVRAWPAEAGPTSDPTHSATALSSNGELERAFMRSVAAEVDRIAHLFPPESVDSDSPAQSTALSPAAK